eukprot:5819734-Pleurochrysis_carterae.AAC.1
MMLRMARSATSLSWCTCGGHVVAWTPLAERKAANSADRNSPALSLNAVKEAMNARTAAGASPLELKRWTALNRGLAMSACMRRPGPRIRGSDPGRGMK